MKKTDNLNNTIQKEINQHIQEDILKILESHVYDCDERDIFYHMFSYLAELCCELSSTQQEAYKIINNGVNNGVNTYLRNGHE